MDISRDAFAIKGIRLGQHRDTLTYFDDEAVRKYPECAPGLTQWEWSVTRAPLSTPSKSKFFDGLVCFVSGSELSYGTSIFTRTTKEADLISQLPLQRDSDLLRGYAWLDTPDFRLSIRMTPRFKNFILEDLTLLERWGDRYRQAKGS